MSLLKERQEPFSFEFPKLGLPILEHIGTSRRIYIPLTSNYIYIGRSDLGISPDINLECFPYSGFVSRIHARINCIFNICFIEDLRSKNGTYVNFLRLHPYKPYHLKSGDMIGFGGSSLGFGKDRVKFVFKIL